MFYMISASPVRIAMVIERYTCLFSYTQHGSLSWLNRGNNTWVDTLAWSQQYQTVLGYLYHCCWITPRFVAEFKIWSLFCKLYFVLIIKRILHIDINQCVMVLLYLIKYGMQSVVQLSFCNGKITSACLDKEGWYVEMGVVHENRQLAVQR